MVSAPLNLPPAKFVFADSKSQRIGIATDSLVSDGVIISGGTINRCVLHPRVRIHSYTDVDESILMDGVEIGRHSKIRRTIIDKGVKIPPDTTIGYDLEADRQRFTVTESGIVVVPKGAEIEERESARLTAVHQYDRPNPHRRPRSDEMRRVLITPNFSKHAEGSALIEVGDTRVICTASVQEKVPPFLYRTGKGWVTAEYGMLPRATTERTDREAARGKQGGRTMEIQRLIGRSLRAAVNPEFLGERTIWLDCDVIQADGGTRTASITGSFVALALALGRLYIDGKIVTLADQLASSPPSPSASSAALPRSTSITKRTRKPAST